MKEYLLYTSFDITLLLVSVVSARHSINVGIYRRKYHRRISLAEFVSRIH
jgi:hypothetical protein